jgi:biuret amidohydrolase
MARIDGALPFAFAFDPATTALIVIDMQRDFIEPAASARASATTCALQAIVPTVARLIAGFRAPACR